jgi:hypothetical protein
MFGEIKKFIESTISKPMEGFQAAATDTFFWFIGVFSDSGKEAKKVHGWKGYLFIWPFAIAFVIILYLFARVFIVE